MLHATFNKPAVQALLEGHGPVRSVEVRLEGGNIAFRPSSNVFDENNLNLMSIDMRKRGGARIEFTGRNLVEVEAALFNPDGNPFFLLELRNGWIIPKPFIDVLKKKKGEPPRTTPHLRIYSGEAHRGRPTLQTPRGILTSGVLGSIQTFQAYHSTTHEDGPLPEEVERAKETLLVFECLARCLLDKRGRAFDTKRIMAIDVAEVAAQLPHIAGPADRESFVKSLPPPEHRLFRDDEDVDEGEDEWFPDPSDKTMHGAALG